MEEKKNEIKLKNVSSISPHNEAIYEVGKKMLADSIEVGRDFSKFMINLSTSAIPIYITLIGFLSLQKLQTILLIIPPISFLVSSVLFVFAYLPKQGKYSLDVIDEIESAISRSITSRNKFIYSGFITFIFAIIFSIILMTQYDKHSADSKMQYEVITMAIPDTLSLNDAQNKIGQFKSKINSLTGNKDIIFKEFKTNKGIIFTAFLK